jgi:[protein-PII] uridylyltransferase
MTPRIVSFKKEIASIHAVAQKRHRSGENARRVVQGISDSVDALLRRTFADDISSVGGHVALVAVGGYGRRELCPHSDVDLLILYDDLERSGQVVERMVRLLWDCGLDLGHSVRKPEECLKYMRDDDITAATMLEARFLAGSEALMRRFQDRSLTRYCKSHTEKFTNLKLASLSESLEGEGRTIYVTEPHIKEGKCCLRDIQHVLWIERIRRKAVEFHEIASHGGFSWEEIRKIEDAYNFYLRVRCELHFINNLRQDTLELDSQVAVARNLGYEDDDNQRGVEKLMSEYYRHARDVRTFAKYYIETKTTGARFLAKLRHRVFSFPVGFNLSCLDGLLYLTEDPKLDGEALVERLLKVFTIAQDLDAGLSQVTCDWIRCGLASIQDDLSRSRTVNRAFLWLLQKGGNTGRVLSLMHDVGLLGRVIPEFTKLECLVNFDGHHQFTVDHHTLRTLRELDRIETSTDYPEPEFQRVFGRVKETLPLRVALLLHDIGKGIAGGSHDVKGREIARVICERLGLDEQTTGTVDFLVYRHLAMSSFSERADFTEDKVIADFVGLVKDRRRLDMLYLLTYIDIRSVGPGTWTSWKGAQLDELYQRAANLLETGDLPEADPTKALEASAIPEEHYATILEHCDLVQHPAYVRETIPEGMLSHVQMVEALQREGEPQVELDELVGCHQVAFCLRDRPRVFADLAGLLLSEGLDILGARIFSRRDGLAIDVFYVVSSDDVRLEMSRRIVNLNRKLIEVDQRKSDVATLVSERTKRYGALSRVRRVHRPRVKFLDDMSTEYSVIEVRASDRPGLLYDLATTLGEFELDVRTAKISTMSDRARDVFYVLDRDGRLITDPARRQQIAAALKKVARYGDVTGRKKGDRVAPQFRED